jgi:hypothetical protein
MKSRKAAVPDAAALPGKKTLKKREKNNSVYAGRSV